MDRKHKSKSYLAKDLQMQCSDICEAFWQLEHIAMVHLGNAELSSAVPFPTWQTRAQLNVEP